MRVGGLIGLHFVCTFFGTETASEIATTGCMQHSLYARNGWHGKCELHSPSLHSPVTAMSRSLTLHAAQV